MAPYRLYWIGAAGQLQGGPAFTCADDREAVRLAQSQLGGQAGELWSGGRMVGRFSKLGVFTPAES